MKRVIAFLFFIVAAQQVLAQNDYIKYVNPFIGTGFHGHTYPGATLPHGMVQLSPDTRLEGWDGCGGYHYDDKYIYGFSHTHLSGTGIPDYCDILLVPMNGEPSPDNKIYGSKFSHEQEAATAGYYSVKLLDNNIDVELTATERVGLHRYKFAGGQNNNVILDLKHRDEVLASSIKIEDEFTISGMRRSKSWAENQYVFFIIKFNKPILKSGIWNNEQLITEKSVEDSKNLKAFFQFDLEGNTTLMAKVAISGVSVDGATKNMEGEMPGWDFDAVKNSATKKWNEELGKIEVEGGNKDDLVNFYTALYHTAVVPNINMDVDGRYRGRDNAIHEANGFTNYSVFSLWDTYRACHPLYTIIDKKRTLDYIKTFLVQYQQGGRLPVWELASNETDCMIGYHSIPVIVDAYAKGIRGFDTDLALEAMRKSATWNHLGLPAYINNGVIAMEDEHESVSKTLEYAYDDWCIAQFAQMIGKQDVYKEYIKRAQYYKNILDIKSGFMRPRKNGDWLSPFEPREVNNNYTEANSWQYTFYYPHDVEGFLRLMGKDKKWLENHLDNLFTAPTQTTGRDQSDITGLIGQYAHGNEPSHHIIYLYNAADKPYKSQKLLHKVMKEFYKNAPDGLIGNEDCGQMSAWYVFSAMGFYPVTPGANKYELGTPLFKNVKINLEGGRVFEVKAPALSDQNFYVNSVKFNPPFYNESGIEYAGLSSVLHSQIEAGGSLTFNLQATPDMMYGSNAKLSSIPKTEDIVVNPVINGGDVSFKGAKKITISGQKQGVNIYYTLDGSVPSKSSRKYTGPILISKNTTVKAIAIDAAGKQSFVTTAKYIKMPHSWTIKLNTPYEKHYNAGGPQGLIDGIVGNNDWRKGGWQGYQHTPLDAVIDLGKLQEVKKVKLKALQDTRAWIVAPKQVMVETSVDGKNFRKAAVVNSSVAVDNLQQQVVDFEIKFEKHKARFIRVKAEQFGKLPSWHEGAGGDTHIFVSEIGIE